MEGPQISAELTVAHPRRLGGCALSSVTNGWEPTSSHSSIRSRIPAAFTTSTTCPNAVAIFANVPLYRISCNQVRKVSPA